MRRLGAAPPLAASSYCLPLSYLEELWRRLSRAFRDAASLQGLVGRAKAGRTERLELAGCCGGSPSIWKYLVRAVQLVFVGPGLLQPGHLSRVHELGSFCLNLPALRLDGFLDRCVVLGHQPLVVVDPLRDPFSLEALVRELLVHRHRGEIDSSVVRL